MISLSDSHRPRVWLLAAGYLLPAGIEAYLLHYATELRRQGFAPELVVFQPLPRTEHRYLRAVRERRIRIRSLFDAVLWPAVAAAALLWLPWKLAASGGLENRKAHGRGDLHRAILKKLAVRQLQAWLARERPDIIHVKGRIIAEALPVLPASRTLYQHALMGTRDPSWEDAEARLFSEFLNRVGRVLVQGRRIAETFASAFGVRRPIDVIYSTAPDECGSELATRSVRRLCTGAMSGGRGSLHFGVVCRFTEQKGIRYILEALSGFRDRRGDVMFTFAGQGPLEGAIKEYASHHRLAHVRVEAMTALRDILPRLDVFVHPGLDDAMPVSIVEALMFGVPVIGSNVGATPELVRDGVEGLIVPPADARALLDAMERFDSLTPTELTGYRQRARQRYEAECAPEKVIAQVAVVYREMLAHHAGSDAVAG